MFTASSLHILILRAPGSAGGSCFWRAPRLGLPSCIAAPAPFLPLPRPRMPTFRRLPRRPPAAPGGGQQPQPPTPSAPPHPRCAGDCLPGPLPTPGARGSAGQGPPPAFRPPGPRLGSTRPPEAKDERTGKFHGGTTDTNPRRRRMPPRAQVRSPALGPAPARRPRPGRALAHRKPPEGRMNG